MSDATFTIPQVRIVIEHVFAAHARRHRRVVHQAVDLPLLANGAKRPLNGMRIGQIDNVRFDRIAMFA